MWGLVYALLLAGLFVRVRTSAAGLPGPAWPAPGEPLWLVRLHHRLFYALLLGAPLEALFLGGRPTGRLAGAGLFAAGVVLYRVGGRTLGPALSPLIAPRPGAALVTAGPYRHVRHPMYAGQMLIAIGAPLTLGGRGLLALSAVAVAVLLWRIAVEEASLARAYPEFPRHAATTKRVFPFIY